MEISELRKKVEDIYQQCLNKRLSEEDKKEIANIYEKYKELSIIVDKQFARALNTLVDLAYETGIQISQEDIKKILDGLKQKTTHEQWKERQKEFIAAAKEIYRKSKDFDENIKLETVGEEIFDLMNEEDWEKFRSEESEIKKRYGDLTKE